ncbi:hypothetical protein Tco_1481323 [Tanacetum coccineum]
MPACSCSSPYLCDSMLCYICLNVHLFGLHRNETPSNTESALWDAPKLRIDVDKCRAHNHTNTEMNESRQRQQQTETEQQHIQTKSSKEFRTAVDEEQQTNTYWKR